MLVVFTLFGFGFGNWLARIPAVRDHLGASTFEMSIIGLTLAGGSLLGLVFAGRSVTWLGPRRAMLLGTIGQAIFMPLGAGLLWVGLPIPGMLALACYGYAFSSGDVAMNVSGAAAERALGKPRLPLLHAGYSLGGVIAMGVGALAEALHVPVPIHFAAVFAVILVVALIALRAVPRSAAEEAAATVTSATEATRTGGTAPAAGTEQLPAHLTTHTGPIHIVPAASAPATPSAPSAAPYNPWRDPRIVLIGCIAMSMALSEGTATDWLPLALADGRGFSNASAALALGVFFIAMMLTRAAGSLILTRFGRVATLRGSAVLVAASIVLVNVVPVPWVGVVAAACWGTGVALGFPIGISAAADNPATAVRGVATVSAIAYGAYLIGPMSIGFLGEHFGLLTAFLPLILFLAFAFFAAGAARETGHQAEGTQNP